MNRRIASVHSLVSIGFSRFRIGRQLEGKPHCRRATDLSTGQSVFLKFYPSSGREFQNATRMHRALRANGRVCKCVDTLAIPKRHDHHLRCRMLETLTGKNGFPPCLVLEAGSFTLEHRLGGRRPTPVEQRALVHSVKFLTTPVRKAKAVDHSGSGGCCGAARAEGRPREPVSVAPRVVPDRLRLEARRPLHGIDDRRRGPFRTHNVSALCCP